jgi:diguanylate cyclase (GGDEF)-like protein
MAIQGIKFIGIALYPIFLYMHIRSLVGYKPLSRLTVALFFVVPAFTAIAVAADPWLHLIVEKYVFTGSFPNRTLIYFRYGSWFFVHTAYSYLFILPALWMLFRMYFLSPRRFRRPVCMLFIAALVMIAVNAVVISGIIDSEFDFTVFTVLTTLILCFHALTIMKSANILMVSREHIYNNISVMIFILDMNKTILDCNDKAAELLKSLSITPFGCEYNHFITTWSEKHNGRVSPYDPNILTIISGAKESHNRIVLEEMIVHGDHLGYMVMVQEITPLYVLFRYLEDSAMFDPLTGLYNRNIYNEKLILLKNEQSLPLGIIIGDVNNLKVVNDTQGHLVGDKLLRTVADILKACAPENAFVIRFGGDEFAIIIPCTSHEACAQIIDKINLRCSEVNDEHFGTPSIALGNALVTDLSQEIEQVIKEADEKMYCDKYDRRRKNKWEQRNT